MISFTQKELILLITTIIESKNDYETEDRAKIKQELLNKLFDERQRLSDVTLSDKSLSLKK
jgi:hypothetical protein